MIWQKLLQLKKYRKIFIYVIFGLMMLLYARIIVGFHTMILAAQNGGFVKLVDENHPLWKYRSTENMICMILLGCGVI